MFGMWLVYGYDMVRMKVGEWQHGYDMVRICLEYVQDTFKNVESSLKYVENPYGFSFGLIQKRRFKPTNGMMIPSDCQWIGLWAISESQSA